VLGNQCEISSYNTVTIDGMETVQITALRTLASS